MAYRSLDVNRTIDLPSRGKLEFRVQQYKPAFHSRYVVDEITGKLVPESISTSSSALKECAAAGGGFNGGHAGGMAGHRRQTAGPLDIVGYPGYEKLSAAERALCSEVR